MRDPVHPRSLWGTGAPFCMDGTPLRHPDEAVAGPGQIVFTDTDRQEAGAVVCCWPVDKPLAERNRTYCVVESVKKEWGKDGDSIVTYDLVLSPADDVHCPSCLAKEIMES